MKQIIMKNYPYAEISKKREMALSEEIKKAMAEKGITPYKMSQSTGISQASIGRWFKGTQNITLHKFMQMAEVLDMDVRLLELKFG